jgi:Signal transduction histidine kinase
VADLDQVADGLDTSARRLSSLLAADRELTADASHQLRTPLTALSMRLEEMIAAADDPMWSGRRAAPPWPRPNDWPTW